MKCLTCEKMASIGYTHKFGKGTVTEYFCYKCFDNMREEFNK